MGETIKVCPECSDSHIIPLSDRGEKSEANYVCNKCLTHFDEPKERERKRDNNITVDSYAKLLEKAEKDDFP